MSLPSIQLQPAGPSAARRALLARRVRLLVAATITYNVIEGIVAITAGTVASSTALIGFGLDSFIEVASAAAVAWQFAGRDPEAREKVALRVIAVSFFALAAYVSVEAVRSLFGGAEAEHSTVGLVLAGLSVAIMPVLSTAQRRAGRELGSRSAVADSKQTLLCTYLSAVLLVGLALNSLFGWSWADPIAALFIAGVAVKEGREAWRGDACCAVPVPTAATTRDGTDDECGCEPGCSCCSGETNITFRRTLADADSRRRDSAVDRAPGDAISGVVERG
ncbi:cation diffusion facilitator family transporter [Plantactinospora sp. WMMC1484]|uniref:cation diffusion facilitator family transporter n=1 Tax=Plantactinospora sp. WMMC1484 TaxID=3404122 RepID=UPI003BF5175F